MNTVCAFAMMLLWVGSPSVPAPMFADPSYAMAVADTQIQEQQKKKAPAVFEELDEQPTPLKTASPVYPKTALRDSLEGTVYLRVLIDERGAVAKVEIEKGVRDDLDTAAIDAMKQWKFKPPTRKGTPVNTSVVVPFRFKLTKEKK
jgi:protein TonB